MIVVAIVSILLGLSAVLIKLTALFWVTLQEPSIWVYNSKQTFQLLGFLNQLAALMDVIPSSY